jgi:hypothetical protein
MSEGSQLSSATFLTSAVAPKNNIAFFSAMNSYLKSVAVPRSAGQVGSGLK